MATHPLPVHQVHDETAAGREGAIDCLEDGEIVLRKLEVTEGIAQDADAMELRVAEAEAAGVAFVKRNRKVTELGALAGETDQITRAVETGNVRKAAPCQFERMTALSTAKIEDAVVALEPDAADQKIDFSGGIAIVLDHIPVGLEVKRIEQGAPPIGGQMTLEVRYRAQRPPTDAPIRLCVFQQGAIHPGVNG